MTQSINKIIARNSIFNTGAFFVRFLVVFAITPYTINKLGTTLFGVWVLIAVITSYAQLSDFGVGRTVIKYVSELDGTRDFEGMNEVINTAMAIYIILGSIAGIILLLFSSFFVSVVFDIPPELYDVALFVYVGVVLIFVMNLIFSVVTSLLNGLQRMDVTSSVSSVSALCSAVGVFIVLELDYGLRGLVLKNGLVSLLTIVTNVWLAKKVLPSMRINPLRASRARFTAIFSFSANVQVGYIVRLLLDPLNKILLSHYLALNYVVFYEVAMRVINLTVAFLRRLVTPIFPAGSQLYAREGSAGVVALYLKSMRYLVVIAVPVFSMLMLVSHPFIRVWLGQGYNISSLSIQIFGIPWLISTLAVPSYLLIQSVGWPSLAMYAMIIYGAANLILGYTMIAAFGYYGLIAGNSIAVAMFGCVSILFFHWKMELPVVETLKTIVNRAMLVNGVVAVIVGVLIWYLGADSLGDLMIAVAVFFLAYVIGILRSGWINTDDMAIMVNILPAKVHGYIAKVITVKKECY